MDINLMIMVTFSPFYQRKNLFLAIFNNHIIAENAADRTFVGVY